MEIFYVLFAFLVFMRGCFVASAIAGAYRRAKKVQELRVDRVVRADVSVLRMMLDFRKWEDEDFFPKAQCIACGADDLHDFYRGPNVVGKVCGKCEIVEYNK